MTNQLETLEAMAATYFAGRDKTQRELCAVVAALAATKLFSVSYADVATVVRNIEAKQGVTMEGLAAVTSDREYDWRNG